MAQAKKKAAAKAAPGRKGSGMKKTAASPTTSLAGKKRVRFEIQAEKDSDVFIAGSFNDWNPRKNKLTFKNGTYGASILLSKGRHEYKFVIGGVWCVDPECSEWTPNGLGSLNSVVVVA